MGFNGAAFFQSGKLRHVDAVLYREPTLQWSRFFSKRKMRALAPAWKLRMETLQWSRFFSKRKMKAAVDPDAQISTLQWSRFFSKRKIPICPSIVTTSYQASMEPLFFKAENIGVRVARLGGAKASMEPLFFKAENSACSHPPA